MGRGWVYSVGWVAFGMCVAFALPSRVSGLEAMLRDQIEDDLEANNLTDISVAMDGQTATLGYRDGALPQGNPHDRLFKAVQIAATVPGDFQRRSEGGVFFGPVTAARADADSLSAVQARLDRAETEAAASASAAAAKACTDKVIRAVASRKLSFVTGSAELTPASDAIIKDIYTTVKACPEGLVLHVEGHTDNVGGLDHNMDLSAQRADAAATALTTLGLPDKMVVSQGFGPNDPVADNATEDGRAENRRVDFILKPA